MPKNVASVNVEISKKYTPIERKAIANDIIKYIRERTQRGHGEDDKPWKGSEANTYSESYKDSLDFKQKKNKSVVNLTLSSDMLTSIRPLKDSPGNIQLGVPFEDEEWGRAKGNILGSYGQPKPNPKKARPFLNISKKEVGAILKNYPLNDEKQRVQTVLSSAIAGELSKRARLILEQKVEENET